jgi:hypothetical protein
MAAKERIKKQQILQNMLTNSLSKKMIASSCATKYTIYCQSSPYIIKTQQRTSTQVKRKE